MKRLHGWHVYLAITFILFGLLITMQIETQTRLSADLSNQSQSDLTVLVKNLTDKRLQLSQELEEAELVLYAYEEDYNDDAKLINQLSGEVNRLEMVNGAVEVVGPGITIQLDGNNLLASDLMIITNELWAAGAEAVSINHVRITPKSGFRHLSAMDKTYLTCDNEVLDFPIVFRVIGNGPGIEKSLTMPGGIADNLAVYQIEMILSMEDELILPASNSKSQPAYGKVPEKHPAG